MKLWRASLSAETGGEVVERTGQPEEGLPAEKTAEVQVIGRPGSR